MTSAAVQANAQPESVADPWNGPYPGILPLTSKRQALEPWDSLPSARCMASGGPGFCSLRKRCAKKGDQADCSWFCSGYAEDKGGSWLWVHAWGKQDRVPVTHTANVGVPGGTRLVHASRHRMAMRCGTVDRQSVRRHTATRTAPDSHSATPRAPHMTEAVLKPVLEPA